MVATAQKNCYIYAILFASILSHSICNAQKTLFSVLEQQQTQNAVMISTNGDAIIAGLLPAHYNYEDGKHKCSELDTYGIHLMMAMIFAINDINEQSNLLPDVKLGYDIRDTCHNSLRVSKEIMALLMQYLPFKEGKYDGFFCEKIKYDEANEETVRTYGPIIGVIGTTMSDSTIATANTIGNFGVIEITPSALAVTQSDNQPPNLYSTQPSFYDHLVVISKIIIALDMTRICLITIEPPETSYRMDLLRTILQDAKICIAQEFSITGDRMSLAMARVIQNLKANNKLQVVVLLGPYEKGVRFMKEAERQNLTGRTWIGAGEWVKSPAIYSIRKEVMGGLLAVSTQTFRSVLITKHLENYVTSDTRNVHLDQLWKKLYNCTPNEENCEVRLGSYEIIDEKKSSCEYYQSELNEDIIYVIDAVYAIAHALHQTLNCTIEFCNSVETFNHTIFNYHLQRVEFSNHANQPVEFQQNKGVRHILIQNLHHDDNCSHFVEVARWNPFESEMIMDTNKIRWRNGESTTIPTEVYETACTPGDRKHSFDQESCYYVCLKCGPSLVSNGTTSQCFKCSPGFKPTNNRSACQEIPPTKLDWRNPVNLTILIFTLLSMLTLLFIVIIFFKYSNTPIVKASNKIMSHIQLLSVALLFILGGSYQFAVTTSLCWFQFAICSVSFPLCEACLLAKTKHVANVFTLSSRIQKVDKSSRLQSRWCKSLIPILFVLSITAIPIIIWLIFTIIDPPNAIPDYRYENEVHILCSSKLHLGLGLVVGFTLVLAIICTILAWKTRKLPDNFSEARYIFICSFSTLVIVALSVPGYYSTVGLLQATFASIAVITFGLSILLLLFIPKIYTILFRPDLNTKEAMLRSIQEFTFGADTRIHTKPK
ncbi:uncharacterized protein TRIADDRAFT_55249 [Trichoplax adhaerens]|uniref:G-protein coupled receptors family 3 profile domain-containing protein n=1 Tax=Trichoplax adhaerens TaxID=10228 RepID=B3RUD7_TRIAD|nr:hypothetical protein TRIADDRAFT_55249 [Trichoplax adhaerens]EDV25793.1 hypothetical protein TRIADDRAFT_55249 [Trichoplax adhaerens]|eukprot:XP_002111826.1 hypothetical protein TRIADDRAFT_55249 [Trichoplax adhaerens]